MKTNKYFSFIGECFAREINEPKHHVGVCLHEVSTSDWGVELYRVWGKNNLVFLREWRHEEEVEWFHGAEFSHTTGGEIHEQWYVALADSFDCLPATPVHGYGEELKLALRYN